MDTDEIGKWGIAMAQQTERLNMEQIYTEHVSAVYNYVFYRLLNRENTEDVVSQVFEKVLMKLDTFDASKASVKTWIFRITENTLIDFYRRRRPTLSIDHEESGLDNVLYVHFDEQYDQMVAPDRQMVLDALKQLPERERMFIYYRYYEGVSNREIARRLNMNENTVSAVMARARQKLRKVIGDKL